MSRVHIVLHRPIYPRNVGMCARAMANMGYSRLIIVGPHPGIVDEAGEFSHEAKQGAVHAQAILREARVYSSQAEFLETEGDGLRIALSGRDARLKSPDWFDETLASMREEAGHSFLNQTIPIYLFFGTEDDGLDPSEMEMCHHVCRLPTFGEITSLNLSHAVLLAGYILRSALGTRPSLDVVAPIKPTSPARMYYPREAIREWLEALGFDLSAPRITIEKTLNRIWLSRCPTNEELRVVDGVLRQTVRRLKSDKTS